MILFSRESSAIAGEANANSPNATFVLNFMYSGLNNIYLNVLKTNIKELSYTNNISFIFGGGI